MTGTLMPQPARKAAKSEPEQAPEKGKDTVRLSPNGLARLKKLAGMMGKLPREAFDEVCLKWVDEEILRLS